MNSNKIKGFFKEFRFLSNFHFSDVILDGVVYPTVEHAYQASKCDSLIYRQQIQECKKPNEARKLGQTCQLRSDWETVKIAVMEDLLRQKFSVEPLKTALLLTDTADLVEDNWWGDTFWGVCNSVGENNLGKLLMKIRKELNEK